MKIIEGVMLLFMVCLISCTEETICHPPTIVSITSRASHPCIATGSIQILPSAGNNYQYKLDKQTYIEQPFFLNVSAGKHTLIVKNVGGCELITEVEVDTVTQSSQFRQVMQILSNQCTPCHSGNNPHAGLNFTNVCDVLKHWQRIEARAIHGIPSPMPQSGLIPQNERNKIANWINSGYSYDK